MNNLGALIEKMNNLGALMSKINNSETVHFLASTNLVQMIQKITCTKFSIDRWFRIIDDPDFSVTHVHIPVNIH